MSEYKEHKLDVVFLSWALCVCLVIAVLYIGINTMITMKGMIDEERALHKDNTCVLFEYNKSGDVIKERAVDCYNNKI